MFPSLLEGFLGYADQNMKPLLVLQSGLVTVTRFWLEIAKIYYCYHKLPKIVARVIPPMPLF